MAPVLFRTAAAAAVALLLGGCMSDDKDDPNAPLPRMSREDAQKWARHFTESMARTAQAPINDKSVRPDFSECVGKHDEVVDDGRFVLDYSARSPLPEAGHAAAVKRIRKELEKRGYDIESYDEMKGDAQVILRARSPKDNFYIFVEAYGEQKSILYDIITPCLLPPGVKQKKI
ncbi:hypothetical protein V2J94_07300 [Streptomyces sp. DSM 41524]|uniref:Lipoprotein n=1 Tax=Streptomyces asiaticus subsp. ignotus TaxID=3098222 RepID=A0ABU7PRH6_9ACTN|nr:hypothetical protein [Streptomyces sp. DSM 41524]